MQRCRTCRRGANALKLGAWASICLCLDFCNSERSGLQAAVGWSDTQAEVEQPDLETLPVLIAASAPGLQDNKDGGTSVNFRPPVDPKLHAALAVALFAVGLTAGGKFLMLQWREATASDVELSKLADKLPPLLYWSASASVALGLGSFFMLLAAGVDV